LIAHPTTRLPERGRRLHAYELVERIGEGGMGEIWLAIDTREGRAQRCAIKLLKQRSREAEARLVREARLSRRLQHPNVVEVRELLRSSDGMLGLVMEHLQGETLTDVIARSGALPLTLVATVGAALASALAAAHACGVVHRDVKPSNVLLATTGGALTPKLLDFGIAASGGGLRPDDEIMGTPGYMAPEQARGAGADVRVDAWALGVVLHECLTGRRLFESPNVTEVMRRTCAGPIPSLSRLPISAPLFVVDLIDRMLERDPERRLTDLAYVEQALRFARDASGPLAEVA
jgi:eukaryotic-like serine/threonine-protein kinase